MAPTFVGFVDLSLICLRASRVQPQQVRRPQSFPSVSLGQVWGWRALPVQNPEHRLGEGAITAGTPAPKFPRCRLVKWGAGVRYRYNTQSTGWEKVHLLQVRRPQSFRRCRFGQVWGWRALPVQHNTQSTGWERVHLLQDA